MPTVNWHSLHLALRSVGEVVGRGIVPAWFAFWLLQRVEWVMANPVSLSDDARLYFRATEAWLHGANPWLVRSDAGYVFAGPPPCLLLNLPLVPLGETAAAIFWPVAGLASMALAIRHYGLPWWWISFPPFIGGLVPGSPDLALLGLVMVGGGAIAAVTKPYAIPGMLGENRWLTVLGAAAIGLITVPLLPWGLFFANWGLISNSLATQSPDAGLPVLMQALVLVAVLSLGRFGLLMATPALWPHTQDHYSVFSLQAIRSSRILAVAVCVPAWAPFGVLVVAWLSAIRRLFARLASLSAQRHPSAPQELADVGSDGHARNRVTRPRSR